MTTEKFLYPTRPVGCIITEPSECGKSVFITNLISNINNEYEKIYIYSPSLHQDLYQKLIKCFSLYLPINIIPNILNEEDIDLVIEEIFKQKVLKRKVTYRIRDIWEYWRIKISRRIWKWGYNYPRWPQWKGDDWS